MRLPGTSEAVERRLVAACNDFGFGLLRQLSGPGDRGNVFISPPSLALALAMAYNGASGATQQAMAATLGLEGLSLEEVNAGFRALRAALADPDPDVRLAIANSL